MMDMKPLQPLKDGIVLLVGTKASNFDNEIRNHPRIVMWDSQQEHWTNKDMPSNTRAVFMTRFLGHAAFTKIVTEARKRNITIFNPTGTGIIVRQVKELLAINAVCPPTTEQVTETKEVRKTDMAAPLNASGTKSVMHVFIPYIDFNLTNAENGRRLLPKAAELGVTTTLESLKQYVWQQRKKLGIAPVVVRKQTSPTRKIITRAQITHVSAKHEPVDVSVEILDNLIKGLQDMRQFFIATVNENNELRARVKAFKTALEGIV